MGSIQKRGEDTWLLTVSKGFGLGGKRQRFTKTVHAKDEEAAFKELVRFEIDVESNNCIKPEKMTFEAYSKYWLKERKDKLGVKTYREYERLLELRIVPAFKKLTLQKIQPKHLIEFYKNLQEDGMRVDGKEGKLSPKTIRHYHTLLTTMLTHAVQWQFIKDNPAKHVEPPRLKKKEAKHLDEVQVLEIIEKLNSEPLKYKLMTLLAIYGGLRRGEISGLRWQDVDTKNNTITISQTTQYVHGVGTIVKDPKTETSIRTISMPEFFRDMFKLLEWQQEEDKKKLQELWHDSDFVFKQDDGKGIFPDTLPKWFKKFLVRHELPIINFHGLRHTNASLLIAQKLDLVTISKRLGHSDTSITTNIYGHLIKSIDRMASDTLENLLKKPVDNSEKSDQVSTKCQQTTKKASK